MFKKIKRLDGKLRSEFDLWVSKNILCPLFGHMWVWWRLIERSKCSRCLITYGEEALDLETSSAFRMTRQVNEYRKLQTPFWRMMGLKATPEEAAVEKWMKNRNMDYYDMQRLRDHQAPILYEKDMERIKNPPKPFKVEYEKKKAE